MLAALIALAGMFVALYLSLYKLGYIGALVCAVGSCEKVQTSRWASLLGAPVAVWGVVFYVVVLAIALVGMRPTLADDRRLSLLLVLVTGGGVLFSAWLTYLELFVIDAICQWCVISALLTVALLLVSVLDLRELSVVDDALIDDAAASLRQPGMGRGISNTAEVSRRAIEENS
jgi:uncharacterized membrane protein